MNTDKPEESCEVSQSSISGDNNSSFEDNCECQMEPLLMKGPLIQVISKLDSTNQLVKQNSIPCKKKIEKLQVITTKEEFEKACAGSHLKIKNESSKIICGNESKLNSTPLPISLNASKKDSDADTVSISSRIKIQQDITEFKSSDAQLKKFKESTNVSNLKVSKVQANRIDVSIAKSKSKDCIIPRIKSKFSPESLQSISQHIKGAIFSGWIGEREFVEKIKDYRDIIEVDEWEESLNQKLKIIVDNISGVKENTKWINITAPYETPCYRLWVSMDSAPFPGHYWFHIVDVVIDSQFGLKVIVNILRNVNSFDGQSWSEREKRFRGDLNMNTEEWKVWLASFSNFKFQDIIFNMLTIFTPSNISSFFRLIVVLSVTLVIAFTAFLRESWHFLLRLLRECGIFVHHATPFLQSVLNFIEKLIGGFYILLAMVYRDIRRPSPPPNQPHFEPHHLPIGPPVNHSRFPIPREGIQTVKYVPPQSWVYKGE